MRLAHADQARNSSIATVRFKVDVGVFYRGFWPLNLVNPLETGEQAKYISGMINFTLRCGKGHEFEAWFGSSAEYDRQLAAGLISCALCDDTSITKGLMAPNLGVKGNKKRDIAPSPNRKNEVAAAALNQQDMAEKTAELMAQMRALKKQVESSFDNVGDAFAETARRIHHGDEEDRGIYGNASKEDVEDLLDEGITVFPLPNLPKDH
jgi:hypothetical protein